MLISTDEQIEIILRQELFSLLEAKYGPPPYTREQIRNSVDFSREQLLEYVTKHGLPSGSYVSGANSSDGIHLDSDGGYWKVYYQERNCQSLKFESANPDEAKEALMDLMIYLSGLVGPIQFSEIFIREKVATFGE